LTFSAVTFPIYSPPAGLSLDFGQIVIPEERDWNGSDGGPGLAAFSFIHTTALVRCHNELRDLEPF
jgi:hypothetical protein